MSPRVPWKWREPLPKEWFSKEIGIALEDLLEIGGDSGKICRDLDEAMAAIQIHLCDGQALVKAAHSHAGRGHKRINLESPPEQTRNWLRNTLADHGSVVVERW